MKIVATTSLPAVDRPNADHWNAARSRQYCNMIYRFMGNKIPQSKAESKSVDTSTVSRGLNNILISIPIYL